MFRTLSLLLPALIPSWRFFDSITASPRLEVSTKAVPSWRPFRPRPSRISLPQTALLLLYNPHWNETLFLVSCCERILASDCAHAVAQIQNRIARDLQLPASDITFRIVLVARAPGSTALTRTTAFTSSPP